MAERSTSQSQKTETPFAPFSGLFEQWAELEKKRIEETHRAIDESAKLMKAAVDYSARLTETWRHMAGQMVQNTPFRFGA